MITNAFKTFLSYILQTSGLNVVGAVNLPVKNVSGATKYLQMSTTNGAFPCSIRTTPTLDVVNTAGIQVGSGNTPPTANDFRLENPISSGLTFSSGSVVRDLDNGNPYIEILFTATNTSANSITIGELGYVQLLNCADTIGSTYSAGSPILLDRTILSTPITIPSSESIAIKYRMTTNVSSASVA